jgi:hypothetical protein
MHVMAQLATESVVCCWNAAIARVRRPRLTCSERAAGVVYITFYAIQLGTVCSLADGSQLVTQIAPQNAADSGLMDQNPKAAIGLL